MIERNGVSNDISKLVDIYGASRFEVNKIFKFCVDNDLILKLEYSYAVTVKGTEQMKQLRKELKLNGIERFIMPYKVHERAKIDKDVIYIPRKK